ncbi:cation diffusion facilitator family transporter [Paenibacillus sacheonensis]|uniref:Cation diffusion facilitator family transporter n=1 Tax=Paenibacillus sacheonensis TaxID=742054 RepID=A0A7X5BZN7_9BACL|nr:cation diffusion facilitator family transporter [Paenibacillus sacheonensis]MBM7568781.1 cation diffusion facilitator family transporter [Paenibacillus sacheonensis]NBC68385.1 cation diffusion facilitator family transporter [Paenibacillus sacheonensis]
MESTYEDIKKGEIGAWVSIGAYLLLSALKLSVGYWTNSEALQADGLNNSTDIIASIAVLIGLRISRKPPDSDHRYGHFRAETVSAMIASFIMFAVGVQVLYQAASSFQSGHEVPQGGLAAWTALFSAGAIYMVYQYNVRLAKRINSQAMMAAAQDNRSDALVSAGAFIGILGAQWGAPWLDQLTALLVGLMICKTAWGIFSDATHALTDGFDDGELQVIKRTIRDVPGVEKIIDIKARIHGNMKLVDVTIGVHHLLNVTESHEITEQVEKEMYDQHHITHVHIHIEPYEVSKR